MEVKDVLYHSIFGKVENLGTDEVDAFKVLDGFYAEISESEDGIEINVLLDSGECVIGKSKHTGRLGLKIAHGKLIRKLLKMEIDKLEEQAKNSF